LMMYGLDESHVFRLFTLAERIVDAVDVVRMIRRVEKYER
jgi:hypothetical protein